MRKLKLILLIGLLGLTAALFGCSGDDGDDGATGAAGISAYQAAVDAGLIDPTEISEQEWYESLTAIATEPPLAPAQESCNVCHGVGDDLSIENMHANAVDTPQSIVSDIVVTSGAGATDSVTFNVFEDDGTTGITGLTSSNFRFYVATLVPAGTVTTNAPVTTWNTVYPERWLYERFSATDPYPFGAFAENGGGSYTYTFAGDLAVGNLTYAPEFDATQPQRLLIRATTSGAGFDNSIGLLDFAIPADGASSTEVGLVREIVVKSACTACHNDPLQNAAHGSGYQAPEACLICHSPIGDFPDEYPDPGTTSTGDLMQDSGAWLASLIHKIHSAIDMPAFPTRIGGAGYGAVTYPKNIKDCEVCHFDDGQANADAWKTNPTVETCTTCHEGVTFSGAAPTHSGGAATNASCTFCHPATGTGFGQSITDAHAVAYDADNLAYNTTITLSPDDDATPNVYEAGDKILVTVTVDVPSFNYLNTDTAYLRSAGLYVYGPRAKAVPVLTTGSTTDPDFVLTYADDPTVVPNQSKSLLSGAAATDPQVMTDATGFKYQLLEVTADMAAGTYMVQSNIDYSLTGDRTTDGRHIGSRYYPLDGWQLVTFQVKTATEEPKVAGECTGCHEQKDFSTMAHRSYFGTDGCIACHDQSGNHADPLTNRVHAVHAASEFGDLADRDWTEVTFPADIEACYTCHNSTSTTYYKTPNGSFAFACIGCHGDTLGAKAHMEQNGAPFPTE